MAIAVDEPWMNGRAGRTFTGCLVLSNDALRFQRCASTLEHFGVRCFYSWSGLTPLCSAPTGGAMPWLAYTSSRAASSGVVSCRVVSCRVLSSVLQRVLQPWINTENYVTELPATSTTPFHRVWQRLNPFERDFIAVGDSVLKSLLPSALGDRTFRECSSRGETIGEQETIWPIRCLAWKRRLACLPRTRFSLQRSQPRVLQFSPPSVRKVFFRL